MAVDILTLNSQLELRYLLNMLIINQYFIDCDKIRCPCCKYQNKMFFLADEVKLHLTRNGFVMEFCQWIWHGEPLDIANSMQTWCNSSFTGEVEGSNPYWNMVMDVISSNFNPHYDVNKKEIPNPKSQRLYSMLYTTDEPL